MPWTSTTQEVQADPLCVKELMSRVCCARLVRCHGDGMHWAMVGDEARGLEQREAEATLDGRIVLAPLQGDCD
jgi:hypothetical protein